MPDRRELTQLLPIARRRPLGLTLTTRAVLAACAVAVVSVLVTALIAVPLAVRAVERQARESLEQQAQVAGRMLRPRLGTYPTGDEERLVRQLRTEEIDAYLIRGGQPDRRGLPPGVVERIASGRDVSTVRRVGGRPSIVVGEALPGRSGLVLVAPRPTDMRRQVLKIIWLPLLAGLASGAGAGVLIARRMVRPIRNAATAAARLRAGDRRVRVPVESPQEAAELAYALNDLAAALATSEGRQREFLLSVSHELRTPLTAIRGYAEALADGVVAAEGAQRAGQTVLAEAERLDRLVSDLLALARLEAADFPLAPARIDLAALVRDAAEAWGGRCAAAGVVLRTEVPDAEVPAFTDPGRIRQVIDGLLENALRVLPAGAPVVLAVGPAPAGAVLEVRDGGPGLSDEDLAVAFERGALRQRYEGVREVGSGLGLALAAGLVRRLGGTIQAGHAPEGGARFTVTLPLT